MNYYPEDAKNSHKATKREDRRSGKLYKRAVQLDARGASGRERHARGAQQVSQSLSETPAPTQASRPTPCREGQGAPGRRWLGEGSVQRTPSWGDSVIFSHGEDHRPHKPAASPQVRTRENTPLHMHKDQPLGQILRAASLITE